jgi:hypothetical protein
VKILRGYPICNPHSPTPTRQYRTVISKRGVTFGDEIKNQLIKNIKVCQ